MTKLCIDCKWCTASNADQTRERDPTCMKGAKSPVDGAYIEACGALRGMWGRLPVSSPATKCGENGDWWEARAKSTSVAP